MKYLRGPLYFYKKTELQLEIFGGNVKQSLRNTTEARTEPPYFLLRRLHTTVKCWWRLLTISKNRNVFFVMIITIVLGTFLERILHWHWHAFSWPLSQTSNDGKIIIFYLVRVNGRGIAVFTSSAVCLLLSPAFARRVKPPLDGHILNFTSV